MLTIYFRILSLSGILLLWSCSKNNDSNLSTIVDPPDSTRPREFIFIPKADAKWIIHYQGSQAYDTLKGYYWDTAYHFYTIITSAIGDTMINDQLYSIADLVRTQIHYTSQHTTSGRLYFIEDTVQQMCYTRTYFWNTYGGNTVPFYPVEDTIVKCHWKWPNGQIQKSDSLNINGVKYPAWTINIDGKKYFYQGFGIGGIAGPFGFSTERVISGSGGMPVSLDFIYKSDSFHFDYPRY